MEFDWEIEVRFQSDTPVIGVDMVPWVHVSVKGSHLPPPNYSVKYSWTKEDSREVCSAKNYVPSVDDIGCMLNFVAVALDDKGVERSLMKRLLTKPVILPPNTPPRNMLLKTKLNQSASLTRPKLVEGSFNILSYNVLADVYAKQGAHSRHCPDWALTWEYRRRNLLIEILSYGADILCLQEVQANHFKDMFQPILAQFGYSGVYKKKKNEVYNGEGELITDGCAIFYKRDKFKMIVKYEVEYGKLALPIIESLPPEKRKESTYQLMKDNIAVVLILEVIGDCNSRASGTAGSRFCIANTHIHRGNGSDASNVRLFQVVNLIKGLERIDASGFPVIICGDMNSVPGSDPHRFLVNGRVGCYEQNHSGDPLGMYKNLRLGHSMHLGSAYSSSWLGEHFNESWQHNKRKIMEPKPLDYILYSEDRLKVDGVLKVLDCIDSMGKRTIPSPEYSSDHVALMANIRIKRGFRGQRNLYPPPDPWAQKQAHPQMPYMFDNFRPHPQIPCMDNNFNPRYPALLVPVAFPRNLLPLAC